MLANCRWRVVMNRLLVVLLGGSSLMACSGRPSTLVLDSAVVDSGEFDPPELSGWKTISAGHYHSCGINETGSILCWGQNDQGQTDAPEGEYLSVSAGSFHSCAIDLQGDPICWGLNDYKQSVPSGGDYVDISAGGLHTCGLQSTGVVVCWGWGEEGQTSPPKDRFTSISTGFVHSYGVTTRGYTKGLGKQ